MGRYIALLRGINVGGNKRVAMADLRALCEGLGFKDARTLLQSGNVVLDSRLGAATIESRMSEAIAQQLSLDVRVVVRTAAELAAVVKHDPFGEFADPPKHYSVSFLASEPAANAVSDIDPAEYQPERFELRGRELYLWLPPGQIQSRLPKVFTEKRLGTTATNRNWNTVTKLHAMAHE